MSQNMLTLLTVAAELRSSGASWQAVGAQVRRSARTCQKWPSRFSDWEQLYRAAQRQRFEEAGNEAMNMMRQMLRNSDGKLKLKAGEILIRYGHQLFARPDAVAGLRGGEDMPSARDIELARHVDDLDKIEKARIDAQRAKEGLPPTTPDEFMDIWLEEQLETIRRNKQNSQRTMVNDAAPPESQDSVTDFKAGGIATLLVLVLAGSLWIGSHAGASGSVEVRARPSTQSSEQTKHATAPFRPIGYNDVMTSNFPAVPELLAPAGDWEALRAAVANGADAVYFGLPQFNARHRATNFAADDLPKIMHYLHDRNVKGFVALNTLIFSDELPAVVDYLKIIADAGADAVIVQDVGLVRLSKRLVPDLPIHASTQMTLTEPRGIAFVHKLGVERVVLARELSLDEIRKVTAATPTPVEVFVHGALCVAYSGQCLTSEALGGRSANRGQCAQACRLPYEMVVDGKPRDLGDRAYLLSPQDLAAHDLIDDLTAAGVVSFKIEGRLKSAHYVAETTQTYRAAIDAAVEQCDFALSKQQQRDLAQVFSRGFTPGFLEGVNHQKLVQGRVPKSRGVPIGKVIGHSRQGVRIELVEADATLIKAGDGVVFDLGKPAEEEPGGRVWEVKFDRAYSRNAELLFAADAIDFSSIPVGCTVWKTDDPALRKRLEQSFASDKPAKRVSISVKVSGRVGEALRVVLRDEKGREASAEWPGPLELARKQPLTREIVREQFDRLGDTPFALGGIEMDLADAVMVPKSVLNDLRRQAVARLMEMREMRYPVAEAAALENLRAEIGQPSTEHLSSRSHALRGNAVCDAPRRERFKRHDALDSQSNTTQSVEDGIPTQSVGTSGNLLKDPSFFLPLPRFGGEGRGEGVNRELPQNAVACEQHPNPLTPTLSPEAGEREKKESRLTVLVRTVEQLDAVLAWKKAVMVYCDFEDTRRYREAVVRCRAAETPVGLATLRILKPGEEGFLRPIITAQPDAVLIRNLASLDYFQKELPGATLIGDFSLNVANEIAADLFIKEGLTRLVPSYDLNWDQLAALVRRADPLWFEPVIHQHMPMFHMEHCVFAAFLSKGKDFRDCGRPCDHHRVELRDRMGAAFPVTPDTGCRNTVFNSVAQSAAEYLARMQEIGLWRFRVDLLKETPAEVGPLLERYARILAGLDDGRNTWRQLQALNQLGVTRGTMQLV